MLPTSLKYYWPSRLADDKRYSTACHLLFLCAPYPYKNIGYHIEFFQKAEERRNWTKEQKQELKKENEKILEEYGYCLMDGHKQRVGNFKIEPPGLFRGRGDHPKQGKLKKRTMPEDVIINIGQYVKIQLCFLLNCRLRVIRDS